jgi:XrtN system VIT domain protein
MPSRNFGDQQQLHDPLVVLATLFSDNVLVPEDDRIKILESQYNARHEALERLWSGENLKTEQVTTKVRVWPQQHMAYTEKLITVYNHQSPGSWRNQEEGIYTFHMPEGAVVSSLSLWIEGKEEKAILTSKQKATTAYQTIVGHERRDPSVVHWQEGNTVSVRVFPVMAGSSRTFKLGITAPLQKDGEELVYENIWFDGPDARKAEEFVKLEVEKEETPIHQASLVPDNQRMVTRTGAYQPRWKASFKDIGLAESSFSFNGYRYYLKPYQRQYVPATIADVYLDINESWTADDFRQIQENASQKRVWVYNRGFQQLAESNQQELFYQLQKQSFSLFPFHLIKNRERSLVIQKSGSYSPSVSDLAGSPFLKNLQAKLDSKNRIKVFQLGQEMSPFIRSLKERRCFDYEIGDLKLLRRLLKENLFIRDTESDNEIIVHSASVVIVKEAGESATTAPDHVMRLFAYNHIMQQLGRKEPTSTDSTAIIKEAEEAYVVSPVSSLIVLETQHDYDRFGIKDSEASLKNASLQNKGAVPEPAEWMMIVLLVTAFFLFVYKTKLV